MKGHYIGKLTPVYRDKLNQIIDSSERSFSSFSEEITYLRRAQCALSEEVLSLLRYLDKKDLLSSYLTNDDTVVF